MRVPPSQGLVHRNILTQLTRERGGAIESSFMGRADVEWVVRRLRLDNRVAQLGPRPRLGGAILAGPPVPRGAMLSRHGAPAAICDALGRR